MTKKDIENIVRRWTEGSHEAWDTFLTLKRAKKYGPALFFIHLSIEKLLKGLVVKRTKDHAPYSHSLVYLMGLASVELSEQDISELEIISSFNVGFRYPEDKNDFMQKQLRSLWRHGRNEQTS
jgi:HEPN domain-containing protein